MTLTKTSGSKPLMSPGKSATTQTAKIGKTNGASWTSTVISSLVSRSPTATVRPRHDRSCSSVSLRISFLTSTMALVCIESTALVVYSMERYTNILGKAFGHFSRHPDRVSKRYIIPGLSCPISVGLAQRCHQVGEAYKHCVHIYMG
jgi:hypothetical protein